MKRIAPSLLLPLTCIALLAGCPDEPGEDAGPPPEDAGETEDDAGPGVDSGPTGCGDVTLEGQCDGNVLSWCNAGTLVVTDCTTEYPDLGATCIEIGSEWGFDCALPPAGPCLVEDDTDTYTTFCTGTEPGCRLNADDSVCYENSGGCAEADIDSCDGEEYLFDCLDNNPFVFNCASYTGGTCEAEVGCKVPEGEECDEEFIFCNEGLDCRVGVCVGDDAGVVDAGDTTDAGDTADAGDTTDAGTLDGGVSDAG